MYMATHAVGTLILAALGHDLVTALSASLAALSSIGPGLGEVGPAGNYGHMGAAALITLSVLMARFSNRFRKVPYEWSRIATVAAVAFCLIVASFLLHRIIDADMRYFRILGDHAAVYVVV